MCCEYYSGTSFWNILFLIDALRRKDSYKVTFPIMVLQKRL